MKLCKQLDSDPWGLPYKMVTEKLVERSPIPGISQPGRLELIVGALFPSEALVEWPTGNSLEIFPVITVDEIRKCAEAIPLGKAPGPDGVPDVVIKVIAKARPDLWSTMFNLCFAEGHFPDRWKTAKLVLLQKGNKPLAEPSSYRPICLLNTAGKFFERVIKSRLESHLESKEGLSVDEYNLSDNQFGFRKGRSTVDAISKAMKIIQEKSIGPSL